MEDSLLTALDANLNRAKEALRVLEDIFRFLYPQAEWTERLRFLRHRLSEPLARYTTQLLAARRVESDPGRAVISDPLDHKNSSFLPGTALGIAKANFKRFQEALRSLEEFSKVLPEEGKRCSKRYQAWRFEGYILEQEILQHLQGPFLKLSQSSPLLYVIVGSDGFGPPRGLKPSGGTVSASLWFETTFQDGKRKKRLSRLEAAVRDLVQGGVDLIQLREKPPCSDQKLLEIARRLRRIIPKTVLFLINDRPDIAVLSGADGVHLGEEDLSAAQARRIVGGFKIVGKSAHSVQAALRAQQEGADYIAVGTIFPSPTKPDLPVKGIPLIRAIQARRKAIRLPWFAIGGITVERLEKLKRIGCRNVVVSSALLQSNNILSATRQFKKQLQEAP